MSESLENVTDNVEALLDMVLANVPALRFRKVLQMLITSLDFSALRVHYHGRLARGVLKEGIPISLVKETVQRNRIKELHIFLKVLVVKKVQVTAGDICTIVGVEGFEICDTIAVMKVEAQNQLRW
jgi:GTP-binding protein